MANEKAQQTLPGVPPAPGKSQTDRAIEALRDFQAGKATTAFVRSCLADLVDHQLLWVALATRIPEGKLRALASKDSPA